MRRFLLPLFVVATLAAGCAASSDEEELGETDSALSQLTAAACKTPVLKTKHSEAEGSAQTTIAGCIVGRTGETGKDVIGRTAAVLGDTARIGRVKAPDGSAVFAKFTPGATSGTLANGLVQDVDVTLKMFASPSSRLRITRRLSADGVYSLRITNVTPFKASIAFLPVTAIEAGELVLDVQMKPEANGLSITGSGAVELEVMKEQAAGASELVRDLFNWLKTELAAP